MGDEVEALRAQFVVEVGVRQVWPFLTLCDNAHTPPRETRLYIGTTFRVGSSPLTFADGDPDVREWLPPRHLAWFVVDAVAEMNLDAFYAAYRVDGRSRPPYDPAMMVGLLLYAYARGIRSSRVIERACHEDVAVRVLAQRRPGHPTIARFVERHQEAIAGLFGDVLTLCACSGLVRVGVVAVDGTKLHAIASRDQNVDYEQLAREIVEEAKAVDAPDGLPAWTVRDRDVVHPPLRLIRRGDVARVSSSPGTRRLRLAAAARREAPLIEASGSSYCYGCYSSRSGSPERRRLRFLSSPPTALG